MPESTTTTTTTGGTFVVVPSAPGRPEDRPLRRNNGTTNLAAMAVEQAELGKEWVVVEKEGDGVEQHEELEFKKDWF